MPTFVFRCSSCDLRVELPERPDGERRHVLGDEVCGVLRRDWRAEGANVAIQNLKQQREKK